MTAIIANSEASAVYRLSEDHDSKPTATWVERYKGNRWDWESMTSQPFTEILAEFNQKGFVCLAIED
jgi:hypothetical protein